MKLTFIIILFVSFTNNVLSCSCAYHSIDRISTELHNAVDFVLIGTVEEFFNPLDHEEYYNSCIENNKCEYAILRIDSLIKGLSNSDIVIINQSSAGNCSKRFAIGEKVIVFGNQILKVTEPSEEIIQFRGGNGTNPPPFMSFIENKVMYSVDKNNNYWNDLILKGLMLYTNQCMSFNRNGHVWNYYMK